MTRHLDPEEHPITVLRHFPARVVTPTGQILRRGLVTLTRARVYFWISVPADGDPLDPAALAYAADIAASDTPLPSRLPMTGAGISVPTVEGTVRVFRAGGCACSSDLGRWRPWRPETTGPRP